MARPPTGDSARPPRTPPAHMLAGSVEADGGDRPGTGGSAKQRPYSSGGSSQGSHGRLSSRGAQRSPHVTINSGTGLPAAPGMQASGRPGSTSSRSERRKDELFGGPSPMPRSARSAGSSARGSARSRPNTAPEASSRGTTAEFEETMHNEPDVLRPDSASSEASSVVEARLVQFQKSFKNKNSAKFHNLQDAFRRSDTNKNGVLGADEIADAMVSLDIPVDKPVIKRLLDRGSNPEGLNFKEFQDQLWLDEKMESMIGKSGAVAGAKGDSSGKKFLWTPLKNPAFKQGTINDTLEAEKIEKGQIPDRLDGNFSSVAYNILSLDPDGKHVPPTVRLPIPSRVKLFDPPPPLGRRIAYDRGDSPYDVINLSEGPLSVNQDANRAHVFQVPVRYDNWFGIPPSLEGIATPLSLNHLLSLALSSSRFATQYLILIPPTSGS